MPLIDVLVTAVVVFAAFTVSVKLWAALGETPLLAVTLTVKLPTAAGVPLSTPAELRVTPLGNEPVSLKAGAG